MSGETPAGTPVEIMAKVVAISTSTVDRITSNRADYPLLLAFAAQECLKHLGIESQILYGKAAWIEILDGQEPRWAFCSDQNPHFWLVNQDNELIDLSLSAAKKKQLLRSQEEVEVLHTPPMLWSDEVPKFCWYSPTGIASPDPSGDRDKKWFESVKRNIDNEMKQGREDYDFPNESILCTGRRLLDDSEKSFEHFDRALSIKGMPEIDHAAL